MDCVVHGVTETNMKERLSWASPMLGLPCSSKGKESACNAENQGSIQGLESSSGEGNGNPLQYSRLENSMDREAWRATVRGITKSQT